MKMDMDELGFFLFMGGQGLSIRIIGEMHTLQKCFVNLQHSFIYSVKSSQRNPPTLEK